MRFNNKQHKQFLNSILLNEENFGSGFEKVETKPLSKFANVKNVIGQVLSDPSIPVKSEIVTALEQIINEVSTIKQKPDSKEFALELGRLVKKSVPAHLQGDVVGLLSRKLNGNVREFVFKGYSNI